MTSPLLTRPGAVPAEEPDTAVAAHYGEPVQEQRALETGWGWIDRSNREVVRVTGPDRLTWLHSITSQYLEGLAPGTTTEALVMDPKGHIRHHMSIVEDGSALWAHVEPNSAAELAAFLDSMRFTLRVEVADLSDSHAVLTLIGPGVESAEATAAIPASATRRPLESGVDLLLPREELAETAERLTAAGARPVGLWAYEARRVAAHEPRLGVDTDHRAIPHEMGWVGSAVHLDKGCYPGQETVARVHNLGRPPRRLAMLHIDGSVDRLPSRGTAVELDGRTVGFVGTVARHHELGPIGLALVKRTVPTDAEFLVDGIAAAQEIIVSPDTGKNVTIDLGRSRS